jgi:hypothetical protein
LAGEVSRWSKHCRPALGDVLYEIGELDLVLTFVSELAETSVDVATLGELIARHHDAQAMLITARSKGLL